MNRRRLLIALGAGALASSNPAFSQPAGQPRRIGFISLLSRASYLQTGRYAAFLQGMNEQGFVEGRDFIVESRFADGNVEQLIAFMAEMKTLNVAAIVTTGTQI